MVRVTIFTLVVILHYSTNFRQFNIEATFAHHSIMEKKVDELLAKVTIEPSSVVAGFSPKIFVVPKHAGSLHSILNLNAFNHPWTYQVSYLFPPSASVPMVLSWQKIAQVSSHYLF